uniref:3-hydroxy-3-methylglutaryl-coenzyme A reductase n=1 Tax=Panagrolaimus sp. PS1159 TaxID=55785 RepID=A0AC35FM53_9BILA
MAEKDTSHPIAEFKDFFQKTLLNHSIENPTLLNDLTEGIKTLLSETHPKFEIGEECVPFPKIELETPEVESLHENEEIDVFDEDESFLRQLKAGKIKHRELEKKVTAERAVVIRKRYFEELLKIDLKDIPDKGYNYELIKGACCENPIGYIPVPVGIAGPILINDEEIYAPLATTEGALIASVNRGCKVITDNGGIKSCVKDFGMTRAPHFSFPDVIDADKFCSWIEDNFSSLKSTFEETSNYAKLIEAEPHQSGKTVMLRCAATTGDAMGMNMVSKGCENVVRYIKKHYKAAEFRCLSSNLCTDKKAAAINWIKGRGKRAICEVTIKSESVQKQLHTTVDRMVEICQEKCSVGSAMAVTIGGQNAQAANVVAAMFIATGQDPAQVVSSSMCQTTMEKSKSGDLIVSCTMNCIEVGTVGGGTILAPQKAALKMLNCCGPHPTTPGKNAERLASIICSTVLAGEISLIAALCTDDLVKSHLRMNRSAVNVHADTEPNLLKMKSHIPVIGHFQSTADISEPETTNSRSGRGLGLIKASDLMNAAGDSPCLQKMKRTNCTNIL